MKYSFLTTFFFGIILTYFLIRLTLCHETQSKKSKNFVLRQRLNPFWRIISATKVLPKDQPPFPSISISPFPSTQQSLYHCRGIVSLDLSHCLGIRTDRNVPPLKTQRRLPVPHGTPHLSQSHHFKTLSYSDGSFSAPQIKEPPRQNPFVNDPKTKPSHQGDLRSGFYRSYPDGKQEMARIGYNPQKWGRPSYHPLLCFNGITKDFWHGELRPGDTHTATGTVELLKAVFAKLPSSVKSVIIRADKGFYDHETIEYLESNKALFVIVAKLTAPVKRTISTLSYQVHSSGLETAEFMYQPTKWKKEYRFVVIRRLIPEDPTEQLTLFSMGKYSYQVIVTNMKLTPLHLWRFYNRRAAVELIIKELKGDYPLGKIPTKHFAANEAYFHTLLFSYNLINWFKRLCLPTEFHNMTLKTLRARLLLIPGELIRPDNRPTLKLPANLLYKHAFEYAIKKIEKLST